MGARLRFSPFRLGGRRFILISDEPGGAMPSGLTEAERDIVRLLRTGASNRQIARARGTSERTIANQVCNLLRKLEVGSRLEIALRRGP